MEIQSENPRPSRMESVIKNEEGGIIPDTQGLVIQIGRDFGN